jgi:hypothetical protein
MMATATVTSFSQNQTIAAAVRTAMNSGPADAADDREERQRARSIAGR